MLLAKREGRDRAIGVRHDRPLQLAAGLIPDDLSEVPGVVLRRGP
jgi:hypothetical protein